MIKVLVVDEASGVVQGVVQNGNAVNIPISSEVLPQVGDHIMVGNNQWAPASSELWAGQNTIAVVNSILPDGTIILEDGYALKFGKLEGDALKVVPGNTVEYNFSDGIVRVLSDEPIRAQVLPRDEDETISAYRVDTTGKRYSFDDFGGYPKVISRARELIETQFENASQLDAIGAQPVKGILFTGPPGTGKTYLAKIIAHVSEAEFFLISGPSIVSKWLGGSENRLRLIFEAAASSPKKKAIIFFDEIDSIAERRSDESHEASRRLVAQLLTLMDGFEKSDTSVVVIAATNRPDVLDPALTRPGRFDWEIEFGTPTQSDRFEILTIGSGEVQAHQDLPLYDIASMTEGWSAADLKLLWTEAALIAASDKRASIAAEDIVMAHERVAHRRSKSGHWTGSETK